VGVTACKPCLPGQSKGSSWTCLGDTGMHPNTLPARHFLSVSQLCPLVCSMVLFSRSKGREAAAHLWKPQCPSLEAIAASTLSAHITVQASIPHLPRSPLNTIQAFSPPTASLGEPLLILQSLVPMSLFQGASPNILRPGEVSLHLNT
jgi:hypothetical protein